MEDFIKMLKKDSRHRESEQSSSGENRVNQEAGKSKKASWTCPPLLSSVIDSNPFDHGRSLSSGIALWNGPSGFGDLYTSALANYMVPRVQSSGLAALGNHALRKVGEHLRCLDRTHHQNTCNRCSPPPEEGEEQLYELQGDPGKKNGEKKLRSQIQKVREWADSSERAQAADKAVASGKPELASAIRAKDVPSLRKAHLLFLARHWGYASDIWRPKPSLLGTSLLASAREWKEKFGSLVVPPEAPLNQLGQAYNTQKSQVSKHSESSGTSLGAKFEHASEVTKGSTRDFESCATNCGFENSAPLDLALDNNSDTNLFGDLKRTNSFDCLDWDILQDVEYFKHVNKESKRPRLEEPTSSEREADPLEVFLAQSPVRATEEASRVPGEAMDGFRSDTEGRTGTSGSTIKDRLISETGLDNRVQRGHTIREYINLKLCPLAQEFLKTAGESSEFCKIMAVLWSSGNGYRLVTECQLQEITANISRLKAELRLIVPSNKELLSLPASLYVDPISKDCPISAVLSSLYNVFMAMKTPEGRKRHLDSMRAEGFVEVANETERLCSLYGDTLEAQEGCCPDIPRDSLAFVLTHGVTLALKLIAEISSLLARCRCETLGTYLTCAFANQEFLNEFVNSVFILKSKQRVMKLSIPMTSQDDFTPGLLSF